MLRVPGRLIPGSPLLATRLPPSLGRDGSIEEVRAKLFAERRQWQAGEEELALTPDDRTISLTSLETNEQTTTIRCEGLRLERKSLEKRFKEQREATAERAARREESERQGSRPASDG